MTRDSLRDGFEVNVDEALDQHIALEGALARHGVTCHLLPPHRDHPDMCFTRDAALATPWGLLGLNPALPHRQDEVSQLLNFAQASGIRTFGRVSRGTVEGGDICIARPGLVFIGCSGERTDEDGAAFVAGLFRAARWEVHIYRFDPRFLHLDTQFCMVRRNLALACSSVLSDEFLATLDSAGIEVIDVSYEESQRLGCNVLALGNDRILSSEDNLRVNALLRRNGLRVETIDVSQFSRCGGGIHCLTMPVARTTQDFGSTASGRVAATLAHAF